VLFIVCAVFEESPVVGLSSVRVCFVDGWGRRKGGKRGKTYQKFATFRQTSNETVLNSSSSAPASPIPLCVRLDLILWGGKREEGGVSELIQGFGRGERCGNAELVGMEKDEEKTQSA